MPFLFYIINTNKQQWRKIEYKGERIMTEEHKQKIRQTHLRLAHGENWTEEDQEKFERERNNRQCRNYRKKHREEYNRLPKYLSKEI